MPGTETVLDRIIDDEQFLKSTGNPNRLILRRTRAALKLLQDAHQLAEKAGLHKDHVYGRPAVQLNNAILRCAAAEDGFKDLP